MSQILKQLLNQYPLENVEKAFVIFFVSKNKIEVKKNILICSLINDTSKEVQEICYLLSKQFDEISIYDLIKVFELLIPVKDKKLNGAFFTPDLITKFLAAETIKKSTDTICDPSCGCGAFLIEAAIYLNKKFNKNIIKIIEENLFGVDILDYSVRRSKILLSLLALLYQEDAEFIKINIIQADSLSLDWKTNLGISQFDVIIGNPPYVKFQDLPLKIRNNLNNNWQTLNTGSFNLYFAFFELGIKLLKESGSLGYITPNNYFTSLSGIELRKFLTNNFLIERIIDFNHLKLFEAQTYTCLTFLSKHKKKHFLFERIHDISNLNKLADISYSKIDFASLENKKWRLIRESDQENIRTIESFGKKLGDLFDIRVGIATCKDSVYFIEGNTLQNGYFIKDQKYAIEEAIVKPVIKISDFSSQNELDNNSRYIIFPYIKVDNKFEIIPAEKLKKQYPECYKYFLACKDELAGRDKGKMQYPEWYAYARTQGLNFYGKKLLTPTFSDKPRFLQEQNPDSLFCNGYAIYEKSKADLFSSNSLSLDVLAKILNSIVMEYYIKLTSVSIEGGYACYQKNFIELFGIPNFSKKELDFLKSESNSEKINKFLIKKYRLNFSTTEEQVQLPSFHDISQLAFQ